MKIHVVCVPYQLDVARWAYALGPQAFLDHGLVAVCEAAGHRVVATSWIELPRAERTRDTVTNLGNIARRTSQVVADAVRGEDSLAIVLEGDCTHAVGAIGGLASAALSSGPGVIWVDAHGDLHTYATTGTGYVGGMPFAVALGWDLEDWWRASGLSTPVRPEAAALIGASDLDPEENTALETHPIARLDADRLAQEPAARVANLLAPRANEAAAWYLHLDVDVAGPGEVPGGLTPTTKAPSRDSLRDAIRAAAASVNVRAVSLATYNPSSDPDGRGARFGLDMLSAMLAGIADRDRV
jgi:arginase